MQMIMNTHFFLFMLNKCFLIKYIHVWCFDWNALYKHSVYDRNHQRIEIDCCKQSVVGLPRNAIWL